MPGTRLKCWWLCGVFGLALAVLLFGDDPGPQPLKKKPTADAVDQVMQQVQAGADGWESEQAAGEIEQVLNGLAQQWSLSQLKLAPLIGSDFRGTPLRPASEKLIRSENGLEVFEGTPDTRLTVGPQRLNSEFQFLVSGYRSFDWIKFKMV